MVSLPVTMDEGTQFADQLEGLLQSVSIVPLKVLSPIHWAYAVEDRLIVSPVNMAIIFIRDFIFNFID